MKKRIPLFSIAAILVAVLWQLAPTAEVSTGSLDGTVTDPSGALVPGATIVVSSDHFVQTAATDWAGRYLVNGLTPGVYQVSVQSAGFAPFEKSDLIVSAGHQTDVNAPLVIGVLKQEITVPATSPLSVHTQHSGS